jgi:hypothetical protein
MKACINIIFHLFWGHDVTRDDINYIRKGIDKQDEQLKAAQKRREI